MKFFKLVKKNKKINILLSGGTSVEKYLNIFLKSNVNWNNIRFYLTDERLTINKKNQNFFFIKKIFINNKINPRIIINIKNIKDKKKYIKTKFPSLNWIADKIINGGCSKRRPDLLLDLLYQIVIIEVDENQHIDYDCSCQNKRIMELSQDLGHRPIIFIRFNPDDYEKNGRNITSCWGQDGKGICVVKKSKKVEWSQRLSVLEENIAYWINPENTTNKTVEIIQLFYDV